MEIAFVRTGKVCIPPECTSTSSTPSYWGCWGCTVLRHSSINYKEFQDKWEASVKSKDCGLTSSPLRSTAQSRRLAASLEL